MKTRIKKKTTFGKRLLRCMFWLFLILISLFVIAFFLFRYYYPQDKLRMLLAEKVTEATG